MYHTLFPDGFHVRLATSTDLLEWTCVTTLEERASQPTIAALSGGGFLVAYERNGSGTTCRGSGSCLAFEHYPNRDALLDNCDVEPSATDPPTVSITQPANGSRVIRSSTVTITASASGAAGLEKVAFYVNGALTCVAPFPPYSCSWRVPSAAGVSYTLRARAVDTAGRPATAEVTVTSRS